MIKRVVEKFFLWPQDAERPPKKEMMFWIIWLVASVIFIDGIVTSTPFALGESRGYCYWVCMIPMVFALHDKQYVRCYLVSKYNLKLVILRHNLFFLLLMLIIPIALDYDYGLEPLIRETTICIYWLSSITLFFIYDMKIRCFVATFIYLNCIIYKAVLRILYWKICYVSNLYLVCIIGCVFLIMVVCIVVVKVRIDRIQKCD